MKSIRIIFLVALITTLTFVLSNAAFAHPGRTASDGCHYCRTNCSSWGVPYGARHCHRSKGIPQPDYPIRSHRGSPGWTEPWSDYLNPNFDSGYSYPSLRDYSSTPSCPLFSSYNSLTSSCECSYGYVADGLGGCEDGDLLCHRKLGYYSSYDSLSNACECDYGYVIDSNNQCVSRDDYCQDLFGFNAEYKILEDACGCRSGYVLNSSQTSCIRGETYCRNLYGLYSDYNRLSKTCECDSGYELRAGRCREIEKKYEIYSPINLELTPPPIPKIESKPAPIPEPEPKSEPKPPAPAYTASVVSLEIKIKDAVLAEKSAYLQNPHWFREGLIERLAKRFGPNFWVGFYVYTLLSDVN